MIQRQRQLREVGGLTAEHVADRDAEIDRFGVDRCVGDQRPRIHEGVDIEIRCRRIEVRRPDRTRDAHRHLVAPDDEVVTGLLEHFRDRTIHGCV